MCTRDNPLMGDSLYSDVVYLVFSKNSNYILGYCVVRKSIQNGLAGPQLPMQAHRDGLNATTPQHAHYIQNIKTHTPRALMKKLSSEIHSTQSAHVQNGKETRHLFIKPVQIWESVWEQLNSCSSPESQTYPVTTGAIFHKLSPKLQDSRDPLSQTLPAAETTEADCRLKERGRERKGAGDEDRARGAGWVKEKGRHHNNRRGKLF